MKFKKKPVVIEAFRWTGDKFQTEDPLWMIQAMKKGEAWIVDDGSEMIIETLEGNMSANRGDYIIRGIKGEIYPCKPDIFKATYSEESDSGLSFGEAIEAMKNGKKVSRSGWNGKNMYAVLMPGYPDGIGVNAVTAKAHNLIEGTMLRYRPYYQLWTAQEDVAMWSPSTSDTLANDWCILD